MWHWWQAAAAGLLFLRLMLRLMMMGYLQAFSMPVPRSAQGVRPSWREHGLWPVREDWRSSLANGVGRTCHYTVVCAYGSYT